MPTGHTDPLVRQVRRLAGAPVTPDLSDGDLLERFVRSGDEAAFEALVERHGARVLGVCRRVLRDEHAAEDAFQATFFVLARKAGSIGRRELLANWLYGVAYRVALRARTEAAKRRQRERQSGRRPPPEPSAEVAGQQLCAILDEELNRLPDRYRAAFLLCYLDGRTRDQAGRELGWSLRTLDRRLRAGRELLQARLRRRGITLSGALLAAGLGTSAAEALPPSLRAAARAVLAATVSRPAAALADGMIRSLILAKVRLSLTLALVAIAAVVGAIVCRTQDPAPAQAEAAAELKKGAALAHTDRYGDPLPAQVVARMGTLRFRQGHTIESVVFTRDGKGLVASSADWTVRMWDPATGREIRRLGDRADRGECLAVSADGQILACGNDEGVIRLWDPASGRELRRFGTNTQHLECLAFAPDGKTLASGSVDAATRLWDVATGKEVPTFQAAPLLEPTTHLGHRRAVLTLAFAPDGKTVAAAGQDDYAVRLLDAVTGKTVRVLSGHASSVYGVVFTPDGKTLISASDDGTIRFWDLLSGRSFRQRSHPDGGIMSLALSSDGRVLASGGGDKDRTLRLWDVASGRQLRQLGDRVNGIKALCFSPDGQTVAAGLGGAIRLWEVATGKEILPRDAHYRWVSSVALAPDGRLVATGGGDRTARLWEATSGRELRRLGGHPDQVETVAFSPDGRTLATGAGKDRAIHLWNVATGKEVRRLRQEKEGHIHSLAFSPDGRLLASGDYWLGDVCLWEVATGKQLHCMKHGDSVLFVAFAPDGKVLASVNGINRLGERLEPEVTLWDVATGKELRRLPREKGWVHELAFSPDGKLLAGTQQGANALIVWDTATGKALFRLSGDLGFVQCVTFSPDGRTLACGGYGNPFIHLWEVTSRKKRAVLRGHGGAVLSLAFSADGRRLVSGSMDTTALVWDLVGRDEEGPLPTELSAARQEALWKDLASTDAMRAYHAVRALAAAPPSALQLLRQRLHPFAALRPGQVEHWIDDLDSERFAVRENASRELERCVDLAEPALRRALAGRPSLDKRRRIDALLAGVEPVASEERLRELRAVEVLELIGTPEARQLLGTIAGGEPTARLTRQAKASLGRLGKR
jgi:RNA polymerase sigma factor (sigma-70 family)